MKIIDEQRKGARVIQQWWEGPNSSRCHMDTKLKREDGWRGYASPQDAWYYGQWINHQERKFCTFAEGDVTMVTCDTEHEFNVYCAEIAAFNRRMAG